MKSATLTLPGGAAVPAVLPYDGADHLLVEEGCPVCGSLHAVMGRLLDGTRSVIGLGTPEKLTPGVVLGREVIPPPDPPTMKIRLPNPDRNYGGYSGQAECCRCRRGVGLLVVEVETMFGMEEDERVLSGRFRVY